ncbi:MAG: hypothetical protein ACFFAJ_07950 [Candidatus Hodarchaeota archaeon]
MNKCPKCGNSIIENSTFCGSCGINLADLSKKDRELSRKSKPLSPSPLSDHLMKKKSPLKPIVIATLIIFAFIFVFFGPVLLGLYNNDNLEYLGEIPELLIPTGNITTLKLILRNEFGQIDIKTDPELSSLFLGRIKVWGPEGYNLTNANKYESSQLDSVATISFLSGGNSDRDNPYLYDLDILIKPNVIIDIDVATSTGDLNIRIDNSAIVDFQVSTVTGHTEVELKDIYEFKVEFPNLATNSGRIWLLLENINYTEQKTNWTIFSTTGGAELHLVQIISEFLGNTDRIFHVEATTGNIKVLTNLLPEYGIRVTANQPSEIADLPSGNSSYQTPNYFNAQWQYLFILETTTGRISFS